ncbi:hypothetical protein GIB67_034597 [Kingdonia uniflora]|uniref:Aminotransferase-like plant mobile domain-containing protein n=1 Tax=Kingdonia uniflora TaxID=39325 RepID=A0A7J7MXI6_9MAGN|nr:hypothetical protein GIB67_034597 [Kingdonia uniflora]
MKKSNSKLLRILDRRPSIQVHGRPNTKKTHHYRSFETFTNPFIILPSGRYVQLIMVSYDDAWSVLSNARQLLPNIESNNIKSENVSILHLRTYLTIAADREDDITIARVFILFMMGYLWFQMANDTVPLEYLAIVANLDEATEYDWGYAILASLYYALDTAVTTGGAITGFSQLLEYWFYEYCGVGHPIVKEEVKFSAYQLLKTWERGNKRKINYQAANLLVSELDDIRIVSLLSRKKMPLQVPNGNYEYYLGDRCWRQLTGTVGIPLDHPFNMSPHLSLTDLQAMRQADFVDYMFGPSALRAVITPVVRIQELTDELATAHRHIGSIDDQLYSHDLHLRRGHDVRVVPLPPGGGAMMRQREFGLRSRGADSSRSGPSK